jgi:hypothetical protein
MSNPAWPWVPIFAFSLVAVFTIAVYASNKDFQKQLAACALKTCPEGQSSKFMQNECLCVTRAK